MRHSYDINKSLDRPVMNVRESLNRSFLAAISKTIKTKFNEDFSSSEEPGTESTRK